LVECKYNNTIGVSLEGDIMALEIKKIRHDELSRLHIDYEISHTGNSTTLTQDLTMTVYGARYVRRIVNLEMHLTELEAESSREALLKMSEWCARMSEALKEASDDKMVEVAL
jgi:hypothetical protein